MGRKNKGKNKQKQKQAAKVAATGAAVAKAAPSPFAGDTAVTKAAAETFPPPSPVSGDAAALLTQPYPLSPSPSVSSTDSVSSIVSSSAFLRGDDHALNHAFKVIKGEGFGDVFDAIELCAATSILQKGQILDAMEEQNTLLKDLLVFLNANKTKEEAAAEESEVVSREVIAAGDAAVAAIVAQEARNREAQEEPEDHLVDVGELVGVFEDTDEDLSEEERQAMETEKVTAAVAAIERDERYPSSIPAVMTTRQLLADEEEADDALQSVDLDDDDDEEEEQLQAVGKVAAATAAVGAATTAAVVTSREVVAEPQEEEESIESMNSDEVMAIEEIALGTDAALALLTAVSESDSYDDTSSKNSDEYSDTADVGEHDAVTSRAVVMEENDDDDMFEAVTSRGVVVDEEEAPPAVTAVSDDESEDSHDSMKDAIAAIEAASSFKEVAEEEVAEVAEEEPIAARSLPPVATPAEDGDDSSLANLCLVAIASKPVIAELNKNATENSTQKAELSQALREQTASLHKLFTLLGGGSDADAVEAQWKDIAEEVENAEVDDDGSIASIASDASESTLANICLVAMATKPVIAELEKNATASTMQKAELTQAMTQQVTSLNKVLMLLQAQTQGAEEEEPPAARSVLPAVAATTTVAAVAAVSAADDDDDDVVEDEEQNVWDVLKAVGVGAVAAVGVGAVAAAAAASKDGDDNDEVVEDKEAPPQASRSVVPAAVAAAAVTNNKKVVKEAEPAEDDDDDDDEHLSNMCLVAMASKPVIAELQKNATESSTQKEELSQALREQNASLQKLFTLLGGGSAAEAVQAQWKDIAEEVENAEVDDDGSIASIVSDASEGTLATICLVAMATKPVIAELEKNADASTVQKAELTQAMKQQVTSLNKVLMLLQAQTQAATGAVEPAGTKAVRQASMNKTAAADVFEDDTSSSANKEETAPVARKKKEKTKDTHLARSVAEYDNIVSPLSSPRDDIPTVEKTLSEDTDETDPLKEEEVVPVAARTRVVAATRAIPVADASPPPPPPSVVSVPKKKTLPSWNAGTTTAAAVAGGAAAATATGATWKFIESDDAIQRRTSKKKEALFGKVMLGKKMTVMKSGGNELRGDSFGYYWEQMRNDKVTFLGDTKAKAPKWATIVATDTETKKKANVRSFLPLLALDGDTKIQLPNSKSKAKASSSSSSAANNGGVHYLTMKYENGQIKNKDIEAAVIVGEIMFDSTGMVLAQGADWKKLFAGKLQLKAQSTSNKMKKWYSHKVSDPWKDGDTLTFKLDLPKNTIGYTIRGASDNKVRSGWMFTNVLAYTNNRVSPNYLQLFAYVGGKQSLQNASKNKASQYENVKFSIVNAAAVAGDDKKKIKK